MRDQGRDAPHIRHIPYTAAPGTGRYFGDHYVTMDRSLPTAEQFDITVFPAGDDSMRLGGDPLRTSPHVRVRIFTNGEWRNLSFTPIGPDAETMSC